MENSYNIRVPNPEESNGLTRAQIELRRIQAMSTPNRHHDDESELRSGFLVHRERYEAGLADSTNGYTPNPARRVAERWKPLRCDREGGVLYGSDGKPKDATIFAADVGIYKVRWLRGRKAGAVEILTPLDYLAARGGSAAGHNCMPQAEPVPDDEPLCAPAIPKGMPSSLKKAFMMAAKALKKPEDELSLPQVIEYFHALKPKQPTFHNPRPVAA